MNLCPSGSAFFFKVLLLRVSYAVSVYRPLCGYVGIARHIRICRHLMAGTSVVPCPRSNACSRNVSGDVDGCGGGGGVGIGAVALGAGREALVHCRMHSHVQSVRALV